MNGVSLKPVFVFVLLSVLYLGSSFGFSSRGEDIGIKCIERERQALLMIKQQLIDDYGHLSSWGNEEHKRECCKWRGVRCSNGTGHVFSLDLNFMDDDVYGPLRGNISASLLELQHLNYLNLSSNDFGGQQIPEFIGSLIKLRHLDLSDANFSGRVPCLLGNLSKLESLDLSSFAYFDRDATVYSDKLEWLSHLSSLRNLSLRGVNLSEATDWVQVVTGLPSLTYLDLEDCDLQSVYTTPIAFVNSSKSLAFLHLYGNNLLSNSTYSWLVPYSGSLIDLDLSSNNIDGSILYHVFSNMSSLMYLDLSSNNLYGSIPHHAFSNMSSLMHLGLSYNGIKSIPKSFRNLCRLKTLDLQDNDLTGQLSDLFLNLSGCTKHSLENLMLDDNKLSGSLPDFTVFSSLKELSLSGNRLNGSFPKSFRQLSNLTILDLSVNQLRGSILPDFSACLSLKELYISENQLNRTLSPSIGQLSKLEVLDLSSNSLEDTITEVHMANLSKLKTIDFSFNSLSLKFNIGWIPPFQLQSIQLAGCKLGPHFPRWLQTQRSFFSLDISNTEISDKVPDWFWDLSPMLFHLNISHNQMSGVLPDLSLKFAGYPRIDISFNCFEGSVPPVPSNVTALILSNNMFSGSTSFLCGITDNAMTILDLSNNQLSGEIPSCFVYGNRLEIFNLANNMLSGKIPNKMDYNYCNIWALDLQNNSFVGELPSSLKNCNRLAIFNMGNNNLSGTIPPWIGVSFPDLVAISLRSNQFHGGIPTQLCNLAKLQVLDFSQNIISGTIPKCVNNLTELTNQTGTLDATTKPSPFSSKENFFDGTEYRSSISLVWKGTDSEYGSTLGLVKSIDLSSNKLYGKIPIEISSLLGLISLNLSRNSLSGAIPPKIGQLHLLNSLDLSNNLLTSEIPESFSQLDSLGVLNLSNNNLSGKIPSSIKPQSFDASSYMGNPELCGTPLPNHCPGDEPAQKSNEDETIRKISENEVGIVAQGFYISMAFGFIIGFWGVCGALVLKKSWRYAYFKFLNDTKDKAYILIAVKIAKLQRELGG